MIVSQSQFMNPPVLACSGLGLVFPMGFNMFGDGRRRHVIFLEFLRRTLSSPRGSWFCLLGVFALLV